MHADRLMFWSLFLPTMVCAQDIVVSGRVTSSASGLPLTHSLVGVPELGRYVFTNDSGAFSVVVDRSVRVVLTIRKIGYEPRDTIISAPSKVSPMRVALSPVAIRLASVTVRAEFECNDPGSNQHASDALVTAMTQLRMNAEQLNVLSDKYPFESRMEADRAVNRRGDSSVILVSRDTLRISSQTRWHYRAGNVVTGSRRFTFNIPTVADIGDEEFLRQHCFYYGGLDSSVHNPLVRIDFLASRRLQTPDVDGSLFLDPMTFQIRRSVVRLSRSRRGRALPAYEVTTDFMEVIESVPIINHIFAKQTFDATARSALDAVYEEWRLLNVSFTGIKPSENMAIVKPANPPQEQDN